MLLGPNGAALNKASWETPARPEEQKRCEGEGGIRGGRNGNGKEKKKEGKGTERGIGCRRMKEKREKGMERLVMEVALERREQCYH